MNKPSIVTIPLHVDDRGSVYCALDNMDKGLLGDKIKRTYVVTNWSKGTIRAWHGHKKAWTGLHVIKGVAKLAAKPILKSPKEQENFLDIVTKVLSDRNPGIFWVPPGWYNGSVSLKDDTKILVYSTLSFDEVKDDDERLELNDMDKKYVFGVKHR